MDIEDAIKECNDSIRPGAIVALSQYVNGSDVEQLCVIAELKPRDQQGNYKVTNILVS
jgi:hypothetical protein